jgi:diaminopimelate decarboxylase
MSGEHRIQGIAISTLTGEYGTPLFVYDGQVISDQYSRLRDRLHPKLDIFYSLKANPNVAVCALLRSLGAGAEVSSAAELLTARQAGVLPDDLIFVGPGKSYAELAMCVRHRIHATVCESITELAELDRIARSEELVAPVALRVNPRLRVAGAALAMGGRPRQFGLDEDQLTAKIMTGFPNLRLVGIHVYLGTRIMSADVVGENSARILALAGALADNLEFDLEFVDIGGGLGVAYFDGESDPDLDTLAARTNPTISDFTARYPKARVVMELGRYLTACAGTYVVTVRAVKRSMGESFAITDGGTNHHLAAVGLGSIAKRSFPISLLNRPGDLRTERWHVAGPLCTPTDLLARGVDLPPVRPGDLVGVHRSGAYGPSSSPGLFLGHGYPAEVLVHDGNHHLVRTRDQPDDILSKQRLPEALAFAEAGIRDEDRVAASVIRSIRRVLNHDEMQLDRETRLFETAGLDSTDILQVLVELEDELDVLFDPDSLDPELLSTVATLTAYVCDQLRRPR